MLWDIPGLGTPSFPADQYIKTFGFRHFDFVVIVCDRTFRQSTEMIVKELCKYGVNAAIVVTRLDALTTEHLSDHQQDETDARMWPRASVQVKNDVRANFRQGTPHQIEIFVTSAKVPEWPGNEIGQFLKHAI